MPGFESLPTWDVTRKALADISAIHGMSASEESELAAAMKTALDNEADLLKKEQLATRFKTVVESVVKGGIKAALFGALGL
jgi:hypothetical protein